MIEDLQALCPELELGPPAAADVLDETERQVGRLPAELRALLASANGVTCRSFRILSAYDQKYPKKTWDSIQRANDAKKTQALAGDPALLERFLVFADIGGGFAAWDRSTGTIWYEEKGDQELKETDLTFEQFVRMMLTQAE